MRSMRMRIVSGEREDSDVERNVACNHTHWMLSWRVEKNEQRSDEDTLGHGPSRGRVVVMSSIRRTLTFLFHLNGVYE
jgi:hypothetical protein